MFYLFPGVCYQKYALLKYVTAYTENAFSLPTKCTIRYESLFLIAMLALLQKFKVISTVLFCLVGTPLSNNPIDIIIVVYYENLL